METTEPRSIVEYLIGWICTLPAEWKRALANLDDTHPSIEKPPDDPNNYTMGSIHDHNIVIAYPPNDEIGNNSAAAIVAARMKSTFPQMRFVLLVGIGSGVPPKVSLLDVVVSIPVKQDPGLVQWAMGKAKKNGSFEHIGSSKQPPASLLTALTKLQKGHELPRAKKPKYYETLLKKRPKVASKLLLWNSLKTKLGKADHSEVNKSTTGDNRDGEEEKTRRSRGEDMNVKMKPANGCLHFGMIASGNQVIEDAELRDKLNKDLGGNVLCVEVGAARLAEIVPCLVIRGIYNSAGSQKNAHCQEDAATMAADFAKNLLEYVKPEDVKREPLAKDMADKVFDSSAGNDSPPDVAVDAGRKLQRLGLTLALAQMLRDKQQNDKTQQSLSQTDIQLGKIKKRQEKLEFEIWKSHLAKEKDKITGYNWQKPQAKVTRKQERLSKQCISTQTRLLKLRQLDGLDHDYEPEEIDTSRLFRWAVEDGDAEVVELFLDRGTDATAVHKDGWMPLQAAASKGHVDVVQLLLERGGVDADSKNDDGRTALQLATERGHGDVMRPLLWKSANNVAALTQVRWQHQGCGTVEFVVFSHDSRLLASATAGNVELWNTATGHCQETLKDPCLKTRNGSERRVKSMAFSHNSKLLASGTNDGAINIWNTTTGQCLQTLQGPTYYVNSVAFSHDSSLLASAVGNIIEIYNLATGSCQKTLEDHRYGIHAVAFSNDPKLLASASDDCTVKLWNTTTGDCQQTLQGHEDWVRSLDFSHDSKLLASGSSSQIKLWNTTTGRCQETLKGYSQCVLPWAFPHGTKLAAVKKSGETIEVWVVPMDILRVNIEEA
ncbi:WD40-repeat-containing domain protein [Trichoderma pleuroticola]